MTRFSTFNRGWHGYVKAIVGRLIVFTKATTAQSSMVVRGLANVVDWTRGPSRFATVKSIYAVLNPVANGNRSLAKRLDLLESGKHYNPTSLQRSLTADGSQKNDKCHPDKAESESTS